jgi:hypothetical protein
MTTPADLPDWSALRADWPNADASRFVEATRSLQTDVEPKALLAFLDKAKLPGSKRALSQLKERLTLDAALRTRAATELRAYFSTKA